MIPTTQVKTGNCIVVDGDPHVVLDRRHITLARKSGKIQLKLRNLRTGLSTERRFASDEKVEIATIEETRMQYLYEDGELYYFMNTENYEQIAINAELIGDNRYYLTEGLVISVSFFEGKAIGVRSPKAVVLEVVETEPALKHATAQAQLKPAVTNTGLKVNVPSFIEPGDKIKVNTETGEYLERA
ncbi:MAG: elongation factor P [Candidatus Stahlbacteria bacterium]|nr:MAG: elongation factor P [Candidatus Stahlbacteria bacterium]